jgi:sugar lactone lactonase YvrE
MSVKERAVGALMGARGAPAAGAVALGLAAALATGGSAAAATAAPATVASAPPPGTAGIISTVAGGVGGPAAATSVSLTPCGASFGGGSLYIADEQTVRRVDPGTGRLTTPVGNGIGDPLGDRGLATGAGLANTCSAVPDGAGNLVIADLDHDRVRIAAARTGMFYGVAMKSGHIYTVAGNGRHGFSGDGGPATHAELLGPDAVALDGAGNLVLTDTENSLIRVVAAHTGRFYGQAMTVGDIYTVAGGGGHGLGDGGPATKAELGLPGAVAADGAGNLVISTFPVPGIPSLLSNRVRVVAARTGTFYGIPMTAGDIYTVVGDGHQGFSGDGGPAAHARLSTPAGVALDGAGNLVLADAGNNRVRVVAARTGRFYGQAMTVGDIYTVAGNGRKGFSGDGGPATSARLGFPSGVAVDGTGDLVIADDSNNRARVVAARTGRFYGQAMTAGDIYTVAGNAGRTFFSGDGGLATRAQFNTLHGVAVDGAGDMAIADLDNNDVRLVRARTAMLFGRPMTARHIYSAAGTGRKGFSGDGGPAARARLFSPMGVAFDGAGNLVIGDRVNNRVRVVAARSGTFYGQAMTVGDIYTIAGDGSIDFSGDGGPATHAGLGQPVGLAVDHVGNLVITANSRVRVVAVRTGRFYGQAMTAGDIYTVAGNGNVNFSGDGGPATKAGLAAPDGVAVDHAGNLVIADSLNFRIRVVAVRTGRFYGQAMTAGDIYTVAGGGRHGLGDGGPATRAELDIPDGVAVDGAGNLVIADTQSNRVRVVAAHTGTFYGVAIKTGDIETIAGRTAGREGEFSGDGGPAVKADLTRPESVATDRAGNLVITDSGNFRVRVVTH